MTDHKSRSKAADQKFAPDAQRPSTRPSAPPIVSAKRVSKPHANEQNLCGMTETGAPLPAGLSGMLGQSHDAGQPVEGRVGEVSVRIAEHGANRSGASFGDSTRPRGMRASVPARRKIDSEG